MLYRERHGFTDVGELLYGRKARQQDATGNGSDSSNRRRAIPYCVLAIGGQPRDVKYIVCTLGGSVAEWLACWTEAQKGPGSNRSRDAVG